MTRRAWCVSIVLDGPRPFTNMMVCESEGEALVLSGLLAGRAFPDGEIACFSAQEIGADWLRRALRLVEGVDKPSVVSLVSDNLRAPRSWQEQEVQRLCINHGGNYSAGAWCPQCRADTHLMPTELPDPA